MLFSSLEFLFRFLPIFLFLYFVIPVRFRNLWVFVASLFFYGYGEPAYIVVMLLEIVINYIFARKITKTHILEFRNNQKNEFLLKRRIYLILALVIDFGLLFVFKYMNFFIGNINALVGKNLIAAVNLKLPLGISFYTFQITAFMIDVYNKKYPAKREFINFATFVCMFPQLIAGPIINFSEISEALRKRRISFINLEYGFSLFAIGLTYKVLLANKIACLWNDVFNIGPYGIDTYTAWLGAIGYTFQIYFDFFGYSLMAIGLGRMMSFNFPDNFRNPYCAKSVKEFWRRWHITLGRWFREYIYIPLGGNRGNVLKTIFNIFVVWAFTGIWHGAEWNFLIWGLLFFVLLIMEKYIYGKFLEKSKIIGHLYMFIILPISWVIFYISDLKLLGAYLKRMLFIPLENSVNVNGLGKFMSLLTDYWWLLAVCALLCTPYPMRIFEKYKRGYLCKLILLGLFWLCVYELANGELNPFLYFRF